MNIITGSVFIGSLIDTSAIGLTNNEDNTYLQQADELQLFSDCKGLYMYNDNAAQVQTIDPNAVCRLWVKSEESSLESITSNFNQLPNCPCNIGSTDFDKTFNTIKDGLNRTLIASLQLIPNGTASVTCGYTATGSFIPTGLNAGSYVSYNPTLYSELYRDNDLKYHDICCVDTDLCTHFHTVRPTKNCSDQSNLHLAFAFGDPHITTIDGKQYTFNGHGEYVILRSSDTNLPLEIQCRTDRAINSDGNATYATIFTGFVVSTSGSWLQALLNNDGVTLQISAGESQASASYFTQDFITNKLDVQRSYLTMKREGGILVASFPSIAFSFNVTVGKKLLQFGIAIDDRLKTKTQGLLGNFNGDPADDFIPRTGSTLAASSSESTIFTNFGQTWVTTSAESQFQYQTGDSHGNFIFDFVPKFLEDANATLVAEANVTCNGAIQCIFDLVFTNDAELALETGSSQIQAAVKVEEAANVVPSIRAESGLVTEDSENILKVTVGVETIFRAVASDTEGDTITYLFDDNTAGATLGTPGQSGVDVSLTLTDLNPKSVSLYAEDLQNVASEILRVVIVLCSGCNNHGTCNFSNSRTDARATDSFKYATCMCESFWTGQDCETDLDGCASGPCSLGRTCTDRDADAHKAAPSLKAYTCSPCPDGYEEVNDKCTDMNECSINATICDQNCVNTAGSYHCTCNSGYRLSTTDQRTCNDINECNEATSTCTQVCTNIDGAFTCSCYNGLTYNAVDNTCTQDTPPQLCDEKDCSNAEGCTVIDNNATCFCKTGFKLQSNDSCSDIDECPTGVCSQECSNQVGAYTCSCFSGYQLDNDKVTCNQCQFPAYGQNCNLNCNCGVGSDHCDPVTGCVCQAGWKDVNCDMDINECEDVNVCGSDVNKECSNMMGSFSCDCANGYVEVNETCVDSNECTNSITNTCEQVCENTVGSFSCGCNPGYNVDPNNNLICVDIDECTANSHGCSQECVNTIGRFRCSCYFGFELNADEKNCTKLSDPCVLFPTVKCSDICNIQNQRPVCSCKSGFELGSDNQTCIDIDECLSPSLNLCTDKNTCRNSEGNYECSCDPGFHLENDQRTCTACNEVTWGVNCANNCNCGQGASTCNPTTGCVCKTGYTGRLCDQDRDECKASVNPCTVVNEECINSVGSFSCNCLTGYQRNGSNVCVETDECFSTLLNNCSQICTNTLGSFTCSCNTGFTLKNLATCVDINECEGQNDCSQLCENSEGGFRCSCNINGFILDLTDRKTCIPEANCDSGSNPCGANTDCTVIDNTEVCVCKSGFQFQTGSTTICEDILDCVLQSNPCSQNCSELAPGYECLCGLDGYKLDTDQVTCIECTEGTFGDDCSQICSCITTNTASCNKVDGTCTCNSGWEGSNCQTDINECTRGTANCGDNSNCINSPGSFACQCNAGFVADGDGVCQACTGNTFGSDCATTCTCETSNTNVCNNVNGACTCKPGWSRTTCATDINECNTPNICGDILKTCANTPGSYSCSCATGYSVNTQDQCIDNDECLRGTDDCIQNCTNTPGSFECVCDIGNFGNGDTCTPCISNTYGVQCAETCYCISANFQTCNPITGCVCNTGWKGLNCSEDINECTAGTSSCVPNSNCVNNDGGYECVCEASFTKDGDNNCVACSSNTYGTNCSQTCDCVGNNTVNSAQTCNSATGVCECKATWNGTRCELDIDECLANTDGCESVPNQGCHNIDNGFECSCFVGYGLNNGTCMLITATTTPVTASAGQSRTTVRVSLNYTVPASDNLNVTATNEQYSSETETGVNSYFQNAMQGSTFVGASVQGSVSPGSIIATVVLITQDTDLAKAQLASAISNLARQNATVPIFGEILYTTSIIIDGTTVELVTLGDADIKCALRLSTSGQCLSNQECKIISGAASCQPVQTSDNFALVVGLGVGLPLFIIAVLIITIIIIHFIKMRKKNRYNTEDVDREAFNNGEFPKGMPTTINTLGRGGPFYGPQVWEEDSSSSPTSDTHRHPRHRDQERFRGPEMYAYDNGVMSNFSWDFLYNYIDPNERYEIQRPRYDLDPHPMYSK